MEHKIFSFVYIPTYFIYTFVTKSCQIKIQLLNELTYLLFVVYLAKILLLLSKKVVIMANVANCKKCGALYIQTAKRDICDKCFELQNKMVSDINTFVIMSEESSVPLDTILTKFNLKIDEFEALYVTGKFVKISQKVTMVCSKCGNVVPIANKTNSMCSSCARKFQNEI